LRAGPDSPAFGRIDLLTVVEHELGHVLGLSDLDPLAVPHDLLTETLTAGVRRFPTPPTQAETTARDNPAAPADPLVVTVPAATAVARAPDRAPPANSVQPQAAAAALAPPLPNRPAVADEFDVVFMAIPLDPEAEWAGASNVARPADDL